MQGVRPWHARGQGVPAMRLHLGAGHAWLGSSPCCQPCILLPVTPSPYLCVPWFL